MEKINIDLYGGKGIFGGKETPLEAEITYCANYKECSFYKKGKCFNAGRWKANCKIGKKQIEKGYTSRSTKYYAFKEKYKKDEKYHILEEPSDIVGKIGDIFVLNLSYLKQLEDGRYVVETSFARDTLTYIQENQFTNELIKLICDGRPRTIFGNEIIRDYQEKIIPRFLYELKIGFFDIYNRFINEYPEYKKIEPNFIGRRAYIYSLRDGTELKDKTVFVKDGEYLKSKESWHSAFLPFNADEADMAIKINRKMTVEITNNEMVDENTVFKD